jgi:hypothetical protein
VQNVPPFLTVETEDEIYRGALSALPPEKIRQLQKMGLSSLIPDP